MSIIRLVSISLTVLLMPTAALAEALKCEIKDAHATYESGQPAIYFEMTNKSARDFFEFTEKNINKPMIMRVDGREMSRPVIRSPIPGGKGIISGNMNMEEVLALAGRLKSGTSTIEFEAVEY